MSFCAFIKDAAMRYDVRQGSFAEAWERFIPSLADRVLADDEYRQNCGACDMRNDCRWCPVYGYLEHRRFGAKVEYLCEVAQARREYVSAWTTQHRRYFQCAGMTFQVDTDEVIGDNTFDAKFRAFEVGQPGDDHVTIRHHFELPGLDEDLGQELYRKPPWAIYRQGESWIYKGIAPDPKNERVHQVAVFNHDYTRARIYGVDNGNWRKGGLTSLTMFPTDQILLAQLLADRQACYIHSSGLVLDGHGLMFVGHSEAGKSTTVRLLRQHAQVLCDDRNIVRRWAEGFRLHGTWSHGEIPDCSPDAAPLRAIFFIEKDTQNLLIPLTDRSDVIRRLLACVIKPFVTAEWWNKTLSVIELLAAEVPAYEMRFDKSGAIVPLLRDLAASPVNLSRVSHPSEGSATFARVRLVDDAR
jgi:hypothetical protein